MVRVRFELGLGSEQTLGLRSGFYIFSYSRLRFGSLGQIYEKKKHDNFWQHDLLISIFNWIFKDTIYEHESYFLTKLLKL